MVFIIVFIVVFVGIFAYAIIAKRKQRAAMAALALQNNWTALSNDAISLEQYLPQYLRGLGQQGMFFSNNAGRTSTSYDMAYRTRIGNHDITFFQFEYTEYYSDFDPATNQQTEHEDTHVFTVLHTNLLAPEPTVLLLHHSFLGKLANFGMHNGLQQLSLEGNFNQSFDTYIAPDSQIEALSLLTPDIMELIIAVGKNGSMQITDQALVLTMENRQLTPKLVLPLLQNLGALLKQIDAKPHITAQQAPQTVQQPSAASAPMQPPAVVPQPAVTIQPSAPQPTAPAQPASVAPAAVQPPAGT